MRIARVEAIPVAYPEPNDANATRHLCLVRMEGDDGQVGWGESITQWPEASQATRCIVEGMAQLLLGEDVTNNGALLGRLRDHAWWYGYRGGIASNAIAALDIAMWDLKGKALGSSVLTLLGGPVHDRLPAIASSHAFLPTIDALAEQAAEWMADGYQGLKVGFGKKGESALGFDAARDLEFVKAIRAAIGPQRMLMIDLGISIRWDVATAVERTRAWEEYGLTWIEEPLGAWDPDGYADLRAKTSTLIAYGEREWNARGVREVLATGTVDVLGCDPGRAEGISGFKAIADLVESHGRSVNAHAWSSAIVIAASLAVSFASPAARLFEFKPIRNPMQHDLVASQPAELRDGWVTPPEGPGLGIAVDESVVDLYRA